MNTGNHVATLAGYVLAPGPSKTHALSAAQYATDSWSKGGVVLLFGIVVLLVVAWRLIPKGPRAGRG